MSVEIKYYFPPFTYFLTSVGPNLLLVLTVTIFTIGIVIAPDLPTKEIIVLGWVQTHRKTLKSSFCWGY